MQAQFGLATILMLVAIVPQPAVFGAPLEDGVVEIAAVARERLLEYPVLWDQECLYNHEMFGLRFGPDKSHKIRFYYGSLHQLMSSKHAALTAMVEIPIRDGKLHGKVRRWSNEGQLLVEVPYVDGKIHGECRFFNYSGELLGTSKLEHGTGIYRAWNAALETPRVTREIQYADGKIVEAPQGSQPTETPD